MSWMSFPLRGLRSGARHRRPECFCRREECLRGPPRSTCYNSDVNRSGPLAFLFLLSVSNLQGIPGDTVGSAVSTVRAGPADFGRVTWGRNTLQLRLMGGKARGETLDIRIRAFFVDSGSGIVWEKTSPAFLAPGREAEVEVDYWV